MAILKNSSLPPGATFTAPTVYSGTRLDNRYVVSSRQMQGHGSDML